MGEVPLEKEVVETYFKGLAESCPNPGIASSAHARRLPTGCRRVGRFRPPE